MQKFIINTDQKAIEKAVKDIEKDFAFRAVQTIKSLRLTSEEERVVLEISRTGRLSHARLVATLAGEIPEIEMLLQAMLAKTYLVALPSVQELGYVLSFSLQPPKPLSPELAHEINNRVNKEGGVTEAYVRHIYESLGEAGLTIIDKVMAEQGRKYAASLAEVRGGGPQVVGKRFIELMQVNGAALEHIYDDRNRVIYRQHTCPYKLKKGETALCDAVNSFDRSLLHALGCSITFTNRLVDGDNHCQAVIERYQSAVETIETSVVKPAPLAPFQEATESAEPTSEVKTNVSSATR